MCASAFATTHAPTFTATALAPALAATLAAATLSATFATAQPASTLSAALTPSALAAALAATLAAATLHSSLAWGHLPCRRHRPRLLQLLPHLEQPRRRRAELRRPGADALLAGRLDQRCQLRPRRLYRARKRLQLLVALHPE